jgi:hypothetical protein
MKEILQTKVLNSLITLQACELCYYLACISLSSVVNISIGSNATPDQEEMLGGNHQEASMKLTSPLSNASTEAYSYL